MTFIESIKTFLASIFLTFYHWTDSYIASVIMYVFLISIIFLLTSFPDYITSCYSGYIKGRKKEIQAIFPKDYYAYKAGVESLYKIEKYKPTWYISVILFGVEYGLYILLFTILRNPLTYISQLSEPVVNTIKDYFLNKTEFHTEFTMIQNFDKFPKELLSTEHYNAFELFCKSFQFKGNSLGANPISLAVQKAPYWWVLPLIIVIVCLLQIGLRLFLSRHTIKNSNTNRRLIMITLNVVPTFMIYALACLTMSQFIEIYFLTLVFINTTRSKLYTVLFPKEKVVDIIRTKKKINKEESECLKLTLVKQAQAQESESTIK